MNKQDALTKLTALEAETKALRAIIEAPDVPAVPTRWKPQDGEDYFQVSAFIGLVLSPSLTLLSQDEYDYGNCFKTHEHAEIAANAVSQTLKVCAAAFTVDPDAGEFIKRKRKWTVFRGEDGCFDWNNYAYGVGHRIYVHTGEQAKQMAAILNAERV
jgi:hypothetical protein